MGSRAGFLRGTRRDESPRPLAGGAAAIGGTERRLRCRAFGTLALWAVVTVTTGCSDLGSLAGVEARTRPSVDLDASEPARFAAHWRDGRAEVSGYRLSVTRYGVPRPGHASLIYVTEPFREGERVKADDPSRNPDDTFEALKLNLSRDFQTGVYDYNTMTSVFAKPGPRSFDLKKVAFSSTEWCGQVYQQLLFRERNIEQFVASYFEGESTVEPLSLSNGSAQPITGDDLFIVLRGLRGELLAPGETSVHPYLPSLFRVRLTHVDLAWTQASVTRSEAAVEVSVDAGRFDCDHYTVRIEDGRVGHFDIEQAYPRRVVRWRWTDRNGGPYEAADSGELLGTTRMKYWELKGPSGVSALRELGLPPIADGS